MVHNQRRVYVNFKIDNSARHVRPFERQGLDEAGDTSLQWRQCPAKIAAHARGGKQYTTRLAPCRFGEVEQSLRLKRKSPLPETFAQSARG